MADMTRREFMRITAASAAAAGLWPRLAAAAADARKPNVLLILADDFGYECVGAYGGTSYKTPVLDKLAREGVRFDYCFAQPLCTPSRVQMLTGLYNVRNYTHFGHMDPGLTTFGNLFKQAGYATCISGKWQLSGGYGQPARFGFDHYCLWQLNRRPSRYRNPGLEIDGRQVDYTNGEYGPDVTTDYALSFMEKNRDKPFFMYCPFILPHDPHEPTPDSPDWGRTGPRGQTPAGVRHFPDMVAYVDKLVGRLVAKLDELKLRENTLVLFTGDNGTAVNVTSMVNGRSVAGGKGSTRDAGTHVPLIASWPGVIAPGRTSADIVDFTDFLPTVCEAAGVAVPEALAIDGRSFMPQLRGEKGKPREWTYCWYSREGWSSEAREFARTVRYKLYRKGGFYDLSKDLAEKQPLQDDQLDEESRQARDLLSKALEQYRNARPKELEKGAAKGKGDAGE